MARLALVLLLALSGCAGPATLAVGGGHGAVVGRRLVVAPAHLVHDGCARVEGGQVGHVVAWLAAEPEPWALLEVEAPLYREVLTLGESPQPGDSGTALISGGRLLGLISGRQAGTVVVTTLTRGAP